MSVEVFPDAVASEVGRLQSAFGFREVRRDPKSLVLESDSVRIEFLHTVYCEVDMQFSLISGEMFDARGFHIADVLDRVDPEIGARWRNKIGQTYSEIAAFCKEIVDTLLANGRDLLDGCSDSFVKLSANRKRLSELAAAELAASCIRPRAEAAFKSGDFDLARQVYRSFHPIALTKVDRKKLEIAESRCATAPSTDSASGSDRPPGSAAPDGTDSGVTTAYVHVQNDGAIMLLRGTSGQPSMMSLERLWQSLQEMKGTLRGIDYSRQNPETPATQFAQEVLSMIEKFKIPIRFVPPFTDTMPLPPTYVPPLIFAAYHDMQDWLRELLRWKVDLEVRDRHRQTALMMAAHAGRDMAVIMLLRAGADPNATDDQGSTPLMFAAQGGFVAIAQELLRAGARLSPKGQHGHTACTLAERFGHHQLAAILKP